MEIQKAPNDTAALSFVANSEAARYVFVVVAAADVMDRGRRYGTFVLACMKSPRAIQRVAIVTLRRAQPRRSARIAPNATYIGVFEVSDHPNGHYSRDLR